jgi:D-xylose transport system permease protein
LIVCLVFNVLTEGRFLTPRNIFNLTIQTVSVAIMATGMVIVIVTRHIDLSVGALLATCTAVMGMTQTAWLPQIFGFELGHPMIPWITIAVGLITGALIGAAQGWLIGYQAIPAFIVTLGGLLIWRNVGWHLTDGATIGPLDKTFILFGGISGTLGAFWSWVVGIIATAVSLFALWSGRRSKAAYGVPVKPLWAELVIMGIVAGAILGFNFQSTEWYEQRARDRAQPCPVWLRHGRRLCRRIWIALFGSGAGRRRDCDDNHRAAHPAGALHLCDRRQP